MNGSSGVPPIPADFRQALKRCGLLGFFTECAYVHHAGYLRWISASVRRDTRRQRIAQATMRLAAQRAEVLLSSGQAEPAERQRSA